MIDMGMPNKARRKRKNGAQHQISSVRVKFGMSDVNLSRNIESETHSLRDTLLWFV